MRNSCRADGRTALRAVPLPLVGLAIVLGPVMALISPLLRSASVGSRRGLLQVALGLPYAWVKQDQSLYNPPRFPTRLGLASPWEAVTHADYSVLLLDAVCWTAVLLVVLIVARLVGRALWRVTTLRRTTAQPAA